MGLTSIAAKEVVSNTRAESRARKSPNFKIVTKKNFEILEKGIPEHLPDHFDIYTTQKRKVVAQARRPILSNRPAVPWWVSGLTSTVLVILASALFVTSALIVVNASSGARFSAAGLVVVFISLALSTIAIFRVRKRIDDLN